MKKMILVFTIACIGQLYGMDPTSLYELRRTGPQPTYHALPKELQKEVMNTALAASTSVDDAVNAIKALGALHGVPYSTQTAIDLLIKTLPNDLEKAINAVQNLQGTTLKDFTKLVHILADKFGLSTQEIAQKFNTPIAQEYLMLGHEFIKLIFKYKLLRPTDDYGASVKKAKELITKGFDPNFSAKEYTYRGLRINMGSEKSILGATYHAQNFYAPSTVRDILKVLLDAGANPTALIELVQNHINGFYMGNEFNDVVAIAALKLLKQYEK